MMFSEAEGVIFSVATKLPPEFCPNEARHMNVSPVVGKVSGFNI